MLPQDFRSVKLSSNFRLLFFLRFPCKSNPNFAPFFGKADLRLMKKWWEARAIPGSRKDMEKLIRRSNSPNSKVYLAKNLALSVTDTYWICPIDLDVSWSQVTLHQYLNTNDHKIPYHNESSYNPNASLGGQMEKYWDMTGSIPVLTKIAYPEYGLQAINEAFATMLHQRQKAAIPSPTPKQVF